eukprot:6173493-Pleurochrysis_carterae.AAC.4
MPMRCAQVRLCVYDAHSSVCEERYRELSRLQVRSPALKANTARLELRRHGTPGFCMHRAP